MDLIINNVQGGTTVWCCSSHVETDSNLLYPPFLPLQSILRKDI